MLRDARLRAFLPWRDRSQSFSDVLTPAVVEFLTGPVATVSSGGA
jgi:hypothetical protein